jgi:hypothetical protein
MGSLSCYEVGFALGSRSTSDPVWRPNLFIVFWQTFVLGNPSAPFPLQDFLLPQLRLTGSRQQIVLVEVLRL